MISTIKGVVAQQTPVISGEGDEAYAKLSKLGAQFTADWKMQLAAGGYCYHVHDQATAIAGGDVTLIVGGGNGTTLDSDQPELAIGVDAGYYLIPLEVHVAVDMDMDANAEYAQILVFADRTQAPPATNASGTSLLASVVNLLDGGGAFPGRCWGGSTGDVTDPVVSDLLAYEKTNVSEFVSNGSATNLTNGLVQRLSVHYEPSYPRLLAGPCQLVVCWGGTVAANGLCSATVAVVPSSWFPAS